MSVVLIAHGNVSFGDQRFATPKDAAHHFAGTFKYDEHEYTIKEKPTSRLRRRSLAADGFWNTGSFALLGGILYASVRAIMVMILGVTASRVSRKSPRPIPGILLHLLCRHFAPIR